MAEESKRAGMLRKIRALLAQSNDPSVTAAEAETFRAKADELMTKYAVEEFELMKAEGSKTHKPEARRVDFNWYVDSDYGDQEVRNSMWSMFRAVYRHARCAVTGEWNYNAGNTMLVAGFPGDLDYADLLYTSLLLQLANSINPKPSPDLDYFGNLAKMRAAGLNWDEVETRMTRGGAVPADVEAWLAKRGKTNDKLGRSNKMLADYRNWCRKTGNEQNYAHHKTYRRSFTMGFVIELRDRLEEREREDAARTTEGGSEYALVLRDIYKTVVEWMYEEFPHLRPDARKSGRVTRYRDNRKIDYGAYGDGKKAGATADITGHPGRRVGGERKGIDS